MSPRSRSSLVAASTALLAGVLCAGCSARFHRKSADKETYRVIQGKAAAVKNMDGEFTLERTNRISLDTLPQVAESAPYLGPEGQTDVGARRLSLEAALAIAVRHSRVYESRKEQLYLAALSLTLARHQLTPLFGARASSALAGRTETAVDVIIDPITQQPTVLVSDNLVEQQRITADASTSASWLIRGVGRITASFTTDFLRYLTGDPRAISSSQVGATLTRPLLRNAGFKQQLENLTQAERDVLYELREFTQYRKNFSVQVATAYYGVLGARDAARNSFLNLESSRKSAERTRALASEGRVTQADLGRLEQQVLSSESAWINAIRGYRQALDNFKLNQLGLPVDTHLILDDAELAALTVLHPTLSVPDSIEVALAARLDRMNARDRFDDAHRRVRVAASFLKPQADLVASAGFNSKQERGAGFQAPDLNRYRWNAGLDVDLPFDRKAERNSYRAALIEERRAERALEQQEDEIRLQVRESWRTLDQAKRNSEISLVGVRLAERRVEEQGLLAELGRAKAQDQVDAQNALNDSKNQLTQALVTHTIARLQFWNNMGILFIKPTGQWEELNDGNTRPAPNP